MIPDQTAQSFGTRVLKGMASVGGAAGMVALLQVVSTAVLARYIEPSEWGRAAFAIAALGLALAVGQFGLVSAIVHVNNLSRAHVSAASLSAWIWSGGCAAVFVALGPVLERLTGIQDLRLFMYALAPCIIIRAVSGIAEGRMLRDRRFAPLSAIELVSYAVGFVAVGIGLAMWGGGAWALVCAHIGGAITRLVGMIWCTGVERWTRPMPSVFEDILPFARGQTLAQAANHVATESDNIIVGTAFGPAALGAYGRAYSIAVAPANSLSTAIDKVFYPNLVGLRRSNSSLAPTYLLATELAVALALPAATLAIFAAPEIVAGLLGPKWTAAVVPLRILSLGLIFRALFQMSDCFCRAVGAVFSSGVRQTAYAACVIIGALCGSSWGPGGVAAGVVLAMGVKYLLMAQLALRELELPAAAYFASMGRGCRVGSLVALAVLVAVEVCRQAQSPAIITCGVAASVLAAMAATRIMTASSQRVVISQ